MNIVKQAFEKINKANTVLITAHIDPDGDAIGSSLAMYNYIKQLGKDVDICLKKAPSNFSFLPGFNNIISDDTNLKNEYDVLIVLDCGDIKRVDIEISKYLLKDILVLDHHITHENFSENTILDTDACATCQIVFDCFRLLNINISKEIGDCIYTGILTDTGSFRHSNVTSHTFETAKQLLDLGINSNQISQDILDTMSLNKFELVKIALNNIEVIEGKISYLYIDKDTLQKYSQNEDGIHEGLVNYGRGIENIEVSIFIRQLDEKEFKVSMRSNRYIDVSQIAQKYGGGGHIRAAGIHHTGNINELKSNLINDIRKVL